MIPPDPQVCTVNELVVEVVLGLVRPPIDIVNGVDTELQLDEENPPVTLTQKGLDATNEQDTELDEPGIEAEQDVIDVPVIQVGKVMTTYPF